MSNHVGDTPELSSEDLCASCYYNMTVEGRTFSEKIKSCGMMSKSRGPQWPVKKCTGYKHRGTTIPLDDMYQMAWTLRTDKRLKSVGFSPPEDEHRRWSGPPSD